MKVKRNRVASGKKAAVTLLARNPNFYREAGRKGGAKSKRHLTFEEASVMGRAGGLAGRGKRKVKAN